LPAIFCQRQPALVTEIRAFIAAQRIN